uniref:MAD1 protein n=1 Tax=Macrostomum lignano TaxID=282301 RepID=A0A1I8JNA6_9PLAT
LRQRATEAERQVAKLQRRRRDSLLQLKGQLESYYKEIEEHLGGVTAQVDDRRAPCREGNAYKGHQRRTDQTFAELTAY